jgi:hypothetical protein
MIKTKGGGVQSQMSPLLLTGVTSWIDECRKVHLEREPYPFVGLLRVNRRIFYGYRTGSFFFRKGTFPAKFCAEGNLVVEIIEKHYID